MDERLQRTLLLMMLVKEGWLEENREHVFPEIASSVELRFLFTVVLDFYDKYGAPCSYDVLVSVLKERTDAKSLDASMRELGECIETDVNDGVFEYVQENLMKYVAMQRFKSGIMQASSALASGDPDRIKEILNETLVMSDIKTHDKGLRYFDDDEINTRTTSERVEHVDVVPTLLKSIDEQLGGGAHKKNLLMFLAPPSRGKSFGLVNIGASALLMNKNVLHVTVEMSKERVARRYDSKITGLTFQEMEKRPKKVVESLQRFKSMYKGRLVIEEWPSRTATVKDIEEYMVKIARKDGFFTDVLVVDYADELRRPKTDSVTYAVGEVFAELRSIAMKHEIPVWTATQTTRDALNKTVIDMDDVADSWDKMKIADVVIAMCQTKTEEQSNKMRLILIKNRDNIRTYKASNMKIDFSRSLISESL